jgi:hypothetical protein
MRRREKKSMKFHFIYKLISIVSLLLIETIYILIIILKIKILRKIIIKPFIVTTYYFIFRI